MIFNFNKFISINEKLDNEFNIGDYVFLFSQNGFKTVTGEFVPPWQNSYGQIIKKSFKDDNIYLVKLNSEINDDISEIINDVHQRRSQLSNFYIKPEKDTITINAKYLIKYDSKEEFDKAVEKIEIDKNTEKYNL